MNTKISIIACLARNGAIGRNNQLLYHITEDMQRFKQLTMGHTVVMGRNTYLSLPKGALPHRRNIVVSSTLADNNHLLADEAHTLADNNHTLAEVNHTRADENLTLADGSMVCKTLTAAIALCRNLGEEEVFIIGGSRLYREALPWANNLYLTLVDDTPQQADAYFPLDQKQVERLHEEGWKVENKQNMHSGNITYQFVTLRKNDTKRD